MSEETRETSPCVLRLLPRLLLLPPPLMMMMMMLMLTVH
jgi:hypothetical protein